MLSQLGAECIKVETALRPDIFRKPHTVYGRAGPATFDQVASNKLSVRMNLKHPEGVALAKRLVAISDIAAESFRAGVMNRLGLGYQDLKAVKSDIVMVSVSSSGQTGPDSHFAGYAPLFGAWGGLGHLSGYRDGPPVEMRHVMDHSVGLNAAVAAVAAMHKRRRTGEGSHVDIAAREVASSLAGEALLAVSGGGYIERMGNEDYWRAPHNLYKTAVEDCWLSIAVETDAQWRILAEVMGQAAIADNSRFATREQRYLNRHMLDEIVGSWCVMQQPEQAAAALQAHGVPAHISWRAGDIVADAHMRARGAIIDVEESDRQKRSAVSVPARFSNSDEPAIERGTPELGEHEEYVYGELLGIDRTERQRLIDENIIH